MLSTLSLSARRYTLLVTAVVLAVALAAASVLMTLTPAQAASNAPETCSTLTCGGSGSGGNVGSMRADSTGFGGSGGFIPGPRFVSA